MSVIPQKFDWRRWHWFCTVEILHALSWESFRLDSFFRLTGITLASKIHLEISESDLSVNQCVSVFARLFLFPRFKRNHKPPPFVPQAFWCLIMSLVRKFFIYTSLLDYSPVEQLPLTNSAGWACRFGLKFPPCKIGPATGVRKGLIRVTCTA